MKFSDGYWNLPDGLSVFSPVEVRDVRVTEDSLTAFATCKTVHSRGDTLNTPLLSVSLSSPIPDVIRVQICHFKGGMKRGPFFTVATEEGFSPRVACTPEGAVLQSGKTLARIATRGAWEVAFSYDGKPMTRSGPKQAGYVVGRAGARYIREQLSLSVGECVYGLGERFTPFVKNGQVVDIWNEDGGTCSEQAYKNIPFYLTSAGYGILVAHPERVSFEVASEVVSRVQFSVEGERLEYYIIGGGNAKEVLRRYTQLTGRPALPPPWSFGLWLTSSFTTDYNEKTVSSFIDGMRDRGIPLHVFHFDCFWMREFQWCDFQWDRDQFPDPEGFLRRLKERGLRICVWLNPYIAQKSALFDEAMSKGFLLKKANGDIWQWDRWQAGMGLVDFTNPGAVEWYKDQLRKLVRVGVDCFKADFGERIPTDVEYHNGADPRGMHNYYSYLYNQTVFQVLEEERGQGEALIFARSATVGSQRFPLHWGGDCSATYESMAESLRGGLSLSLSGFGFWSHDISGFEGTPTPDLYKRWTAFGLLSSHSRLHGNESYRVPWLYGEESSEVLRFFVQLKCRLMPYLFAMACEASQEGIPLMRAMMLEFPEDAGCLYLDRQYMLGDSLLVAPIFSEDGSVTYYRPRGRWTHLLTGEVVEGGGWKTEKHGYLSLPLLVRPNRIIALGRDETRPDYDYADGVCFHLFELEDGRRAGAKIFESHGEKAMEIMILRKDRVLVIEARGARKPWNVCLRNITRVESVKGGMAREGKSGVVISPESGDRTVTVTLTAD